jgi:chromosomal replication initiator protein
MMHGMDDYWQDCLERLRSALPPVQFDRWIAPLELVAAGDSGVHIRAPNRMVVNWVRDRAMHVFGPVAEEHFVPGVLVEIAARDNSREEPPASGAAAAATALQPPPRAASHPPMHRPRPRRCAPPPEGHGRRPRQRARSAGINPAFTFDNFVIGKANQMARAAAVQVAANPGNDYNPLFVYGSTGLGKTHLMQAVGNARPATNPEARVRYVHANEYIGDVVKAYQNRSFEEFKAYYRSLDLLLIDDVHFFSGKEKTQEEFFYAFNYLIDEQKQVLITSDTLPKDITGLEERLVSRFGYGLTVAIEPPELEMRVAILLGKAKAEKIELGNNVAFFIARRIPVQRARTRGRAQARAGLPPIQRTAAQHRVGQVRRCAMCSPVQPRTAGRADPQGGGRVLRHPRVGTVRHAQDAHHRRCRARSPCSLCRQGTDLSCRCRRSARSFGGQRRHDTRAARRGAARSTEAAQVRGPVERRAARARSDHPGAASCAHVHRLAGQVLWRTCCMLAAQVAVLSNRPTRR